MTNPLGSPGRPADPRSVLHDVFGFSAFRGQQEAIVSCVVAGGDALVLMPTGGGKSLCYQIPALLRPGTAIVVSPLIALMQDQVTALAPARPARGVPELEPVARGAEPGRAGRPPRASWTCSTWRPSGS